MKICMGVIGTMLLALLVVGNAFGSGTDEKGADAASGPVKIRAIAYDNPAEDPILGAYLSEFEARYPNLDLEWEGLGSEGARTKIAIEMASGTPADINILSKALAREYSELGLLTNLWPYVSADPEWRFSFVDSFYQDNLWGDDDVLYRLPTGTPYGGMYCNMEVLGEISVTEPAATWEELLDHARKLRAIGKSAFMNAGKDYRWAWFFSQVLVRTAGVEKFQNLGFGDLKTEWDNAENGVLEAFTLMKELMDNGGFPEDVNGIDRTPTAYVLFGDGEAAYYYEGNWLFNAFAKQVSEEFRDRLVWAPFPMIEGAKGDQDVGVGNVAMGYSISSKVTDKTKLDVCLDLIRGLTGPDMATQYAITKNTIPFVKLPKEVFEQMHPLTAQVIAYYETHLAIPPSDVDFPSPIDNALKKIAVPAVIGGTMTPEEAVAEVQKRAVEYWQNN